MEANYFTILYWFCHTLTWILHGCTWVPHPECPSQPPSPSVSSGSSQCTSPEHPVSCLEPGLVIHFTCDNLHVSMPFSQIIPPSPSPTKSKRLFYTSVSLLLSRIQAFERPYIGLPWWLSGKESTCQFSGHTSFIPGPGRSHMQQGNQARAPPLLSLCSRARAPQREATEMRSPRTTTREKPPMQGRPNTAENK